MNNRKKGSPVGEIALFYPCDSLSRQITSWARKHPGCTIQSSFSKTLPEIRSVLERVDVAVVDATEDHAQAADAFLQASARLGTNGAAMYSERMHDDMEVFVRSRGALVLLGPLDEAEWDGFLDLALYGKRERSWRKAA